MAVTVHVFLHLHDAILLHVCSNYVTMYDFFSHFRILCHLSYEISKSICLCGSNMTKYGNVQGV